MGSESAVFYSNNGHEAMLYPARLATSSNPLGTTPFTGSAAASCASKTFAVALRVGGAVFSILTFSSTIVDLPRTGGRLHESLAPRRSITRVSNECPMHPIVRSRATIVSSGVEADLRRRTAGNGCLPGRNGEDIHYISSLSDEVC